MHRVFKTVLVTVACLLVVGAATAVAANTLGRKYGAGAAATYTKRAEQGTNHAVSAVKRPAVKGKKVVVISQGQASISSSGPANGAMAAAKAIGWKATLLDAKLSPSNYGSLIKQAIGLGANAIVLVEIDCSYVQQPLRQAKAKGIAVIGLYAYDCNDPISSVKSSSLFTTCVNYQDLPCTKLDDFTASYGRDQANYIITSSKNKAKVLEVTDNEFAVLRLTSKGFDDQIAHSGGSQVVAKVDITTGDLLANKVPGMIAAALLKYPDVTWIKSPYTYATILGITPTTNKTPGKYKIMGGEGYQPELALIPNGQVTAANIISSDWTGWASIDALNSYFAKKPTVDSGIGWIIADKNHNVPASGDYVPPINYKAAFKKAWGK